MARFGIGGVRGAIYTRTGRAFFADTATEQALLGRLADAMKARGLIDEQYAPVGTAAIGGLAAAIGLLEAARERGVDIAGLQDRFAQRHEAALRYDTVWRRYAWDVSTLDDLKLAPFHLLATDGAVHDDRDHAWHMRTLASICAADSGVLLATQWREVELADEEAVRSAAQWWDELPEAGGEGVVIKPSGYITRGGKGLVQPALKVRGRKYLRLGAGFRRRNQPQGSPPWFSLHESYSPTPQLAVNGQSATEKALAKSGHRIIAAQLTDVDTKRMSTAVAAASRRRYVAYVGKGRLGLVSPSSFGNESSGLWLCA